MDTIPNPPKLSKLDRELIAVLVYEELGYTQMRYRITEMQTHTVQFILEFAPERYAYHRRLAAQIRVLGKRSDARER